MGYVSNVRNTVNERKYLISTSENRGVWQTAVFGRFMGIANMFRPLMLVGSADEDQAKRTHAQVEQTVAKIRPSEWHLSRSLLMQANFEESIGFDIQSVVDDLPDPSKYQNIVSELNKPNGNKDAES